MRIREVGLTTESLDAAVDFYERTLELPVERSTTGARIDIGASTLLLSEGPADGGAHHVAFTIPSDRFDEGLQWLRARVPLLGREDPDRPGPVEDFRITAPPWNSRSVYFLGPDGIILELIARYALPASSAGPFSSTDLLCISEIGIATPDVTGTVRNLTETFGLTAFGDSSPGFAPLGDQHGLLIVVHEHRIWFPTESTRPSRTPVTVTLDADRAGTVRCGEALVLRAPSESPH